jgi:anti-sigma regulatory factor (Ser/Thr protein kinase)/anti-anti-sigma regulatory factor
VCSQTVELLVRATGHTDDITLLAVQRIPVVPDLALDLPAQPVQLREARRLLGEWLGRIGAVGEDVFALQHAIGELLANAVEHAGTDDGATVSVEATLTPAGVVLAAVTDRGTWREPQRQANRGRGLALTSRLVSLLKVDHAENGTVARVSKPLSRPARLLDLAVSAANAATPPDEPEFRIVEQAGDDEAHVRLEGPLDLRTATLARQELLRRSRGGTVPMTVDLSGVTHLSSAGVSALHHVAGHHATQDVPLTLEAAPGTPAQVILELVALLPAR